MTSTRRNFRTLTRGESLEQRLALSAEGLAWGNAPYLSLSFAPDGTLADGTSSALFAHMNSIASESQWQTAIVDAFHTWAIQTNGDVGVVADSGDEFGVDGQTRGDERFGDIRIGAIPMRESVYAIAVQSGSVAGTWAGDVFFNTNRLSELTSVDEVYRVALHEAGHVFGMDDSGNASSLMFSTGIPQVSQPSPEDLDELWARFGQRSPDHYDREESNDVPGAATHLYSSGSFDGTTPLIFHGDIGANDTDFYRLDILDHYAGTVSLEVRTAGLSQLRPTIQVFSEETGALVASDTMGADGQVSVVLPATAVAADDRFYVKVDSEPATIHSIGSYALVGTFDALLQTTPEVVDRFASPEFRFLEGDDIRDVFAGDVNGVIPFFGDDLHTNDTLQVATVLEPVPGFNEGVKYELLGSISDAADADFYALQSAANDPPNGNSGVATFYVQSIGDVNFDWDITVFDAAGNALPFHNLLNHDGERLIQVTNLESDAQYFVGIQSPAESMGTGNYRLTMLGGLESTELSVWRQDVVSNENAREFTKFVLRPELTMFAMDGQSAESSAMTVSVYRLSESAPLVEINGSTAGFKSANSVLLSPGVYRVVVETTAETPTPFSIISERLSDPLAVIFVPIGNNPVMKLDDFDEEFVFPDENEPPQPPDDPAREFPHAVRMTSPGRTPLRRHRIVVDGQRPSLDTQPDLPPELA